VKLALKEDIIPAAADKVVFVIAPIISATTCFMSFAVIPITGEVTMFGHKTAMQLTDIPVGVLVHPCDRICWCLRNCFSRLVIRFNISIAWWPALKRASYFI